MAWYRVGTATVTNGSPNVTGTGTAWVQKARAADGFRGPDGKVYEILNVTSDTALVLAENYEGSSTTGAYAIVPTQGLTATLAAAVQQLIADLTPLVSTAGAGKFGDGTLAAPGVSFISDADTGIRRIGANQVALVTGGVDRITADGSGGVNIAAAAGVVNIAGTAVNIDASGNTRLRTKTTAPSLTTPGELVFNLLSSNTTLVISTRGSDGVTRTANIALV